MGANYGDYRGGASATIGHGITAKAAPDGYTMMLGTSGGPITGPLYGVQVNYAPLRDFAPIGMLADIPLVVAVPASLPVNNIVELIELSRSRSAGLNFASPGAAPIGEIYPGFNSSTWFCVLFPATGRESK